MGAVCTKVKPKKEMEDLQVCKDCLREPTILRQILEQFSTKELIQLSLVNKLWNFEARSVMKERGTMQAIFSPIQDDDPYQKLVSFVSDMENMRVIPFSGIHVNMHHRIVCRSISNESLFSSYDRILKRLQWKYFTVTVCDKCQRQQCQNCSVLNLVTKILAASCGVLEELSLNFGRDEFYQNIFQGCTFPSLKILKVEPGDFDGTYEPLTGAFMKALVSRAPNLQELHIDGDINLEENILEGSSAVLVPTRTFCPLFEQICEGLISSLRVSTMEIFIEDRELDPLVLNKFIPMVLAASRTTLKTLDIDFPFFVPLMCLGICLENLTTLQVYINEKKRDNNEPSIPLDIPDGLVFPHVFPKLKYGLVSEYYDQGHRYYLLKLSPTSPFNKN